MRRLRVVILVCAILGGLVLSLALFGVFDSDSSDKEFDSNRWKRNRVAYFPSSESWRMLHNLPNQHLPMGMTLTETTNLLGDATNEMWTDTVYVYNPGTKNGWMIE